MSQPPRVAPADARPYEEVAGSNPAPAHPLPCYECPSPETCRLQQRCVHYAHATPDRAANLNPVLVRQLAATILRVRAHGHGTREGAAIDLIQEMWDLGWDITPRLDTIGSKRERERRSSR